MATTAATTQNSYQWQTPTATTAKDGPAATAGAAGTARALKGLGNNFDTFLKLLTTQMKNQDPLKPQDPNEMTNQLVSFANVEQNIATNQRLDKLVAMNQANRAASTLSYIDKTVNALSDKVVLPATGGVNLELALASGAKAVEINVYDASNKKVQTLAGTTATGPQTVHWDGKDSLGNPLKEGLYSFGVKATDAKGKPVESLTRTSGKVTGVDITGEEALLHLGPISVRLSDVQAVR